jgi:hypothetical protein
MRSSKLSILAVALAATAFAGACNRADDSTADTYGTEPATATPEQPATTTPADTAGTSTAATDTTAAQPTTPPPAPTATTPTTPMTTADASTPFDDLDVNNDDALSRDELPASSPLLQDFSTADKDANGTLSRAEVDAQRGNMPPPGN